MTEEGIFYILAGAIGFVTIYSFDFAALKRVRLAKPVIWAVGGGLIVYSLTEACLFSQKLGLPSWSFPIGCFLLFFALLFQIYSLFIALPFRKTYVSTGVSGKLVKTGMYALIRHPGVPWFILLMIALILVSDSFLLLITAPILTLLNLAIVLTQDKVIFPRLFPGYEDYRSETPMLIPNRKSINAFLKSFHITKNLKEGTR